MNAFRKNLTDAPDAPDDSNWLLTYGDIMTLLMSFFVFIFSATYMDDAFFGEVLESLSAAVGSGIERPTAAASVVPDLRREIELRGLAHDTEVLPDRTAVRIYGADSIFFEEGSAALHDTAEPVLRSIAGLLREVGHDVRVEGHAARNETGDDGRTPWNLSTARAVRVIRYLEEAGIESRRLAAGGLGDTRPRYPPNAENRARNRRVEIVLVPTRGFRSATF